MSKKVWYFNHGSGSFHILLLHLQNTAVQTSYIYSRGMKQLSVDEPAQTTGRSTAAAALWHSSPAGLPHT